MSFAVGSDNAPDMPQSSAAYPNRDILLSSAFSGANFINISKTTIACVLPMIFQNNIHLSLTITCVQSSLRNI
ncbi:hypothetical protein Hypma_005195 [Hypsizygus marmoreus]|uniref:Uncharacterized protein n=1 Tax=Hypsizygus marmoreus TaxID=39966 RepID=A0A369IZF5_HYPMA|nr:hypothetical protein Hypma_005195 [Hypsizygus marmoreus]